MQANDFLGRLRRGQQILMLGIRQARTTDIIRMARSSGHHAVMIDLEHSSMSVQTACELSAAAGDLGMSAFVRVPERDYGTIGRVLDGGAHGVVAPRIETGAQALEIARACRFPPVGQRSQVGTVPLFGMRPTPADHLNPAVDARTVVQIIVETPTAIANVDDIAAQEGVDIVVLGANDFTAELGIPGHYDHPALDEAVAATADACKKHNKLFMLGGIGDPERYRQLASRGACPLILTGMDADLLYRALAVRVNSLDNHVQEGHR
ncbi:aldolase/citrate lyase family protein [Dactylosporangium sp. AC04546]|uniref:HpcH/HpaI aldolase family protein n=1 Tax=Dactylosporangium sp. AC04546 TaxID=2862460 RepID=UPI001EDFCE16|nr:aldolase/citrate lyase family protein [Dactylosporangium sp. AC04546]WVK86535.1 aldolase/citrate lyase family protein [Dactylosporangium sp. AC04546]